ncbi:hypothetical protein [uncultured Draconibacterium sp.]|uniref:hypothetical protein n=1 Tax=uncultured Draconibacterium sp. TaxID=1573823 RepID=UPI0025D740CD|nr:hypothetical protein [uncultured Draconibacterium sp.]
MKKGKEIILLALVLITLVGGCHYEEIFPTAPDRVLLKSSPNNFQSICDPVAIPLRSAINKDVGFLLVSNNSTSVNIQFSALNKYSISEVHLWAGTDPEQVPQNKQKIPVPGKFTYKAEGKNIDIFNIKLADIYHIPEMLLEGKAIYLFAHAIFNDNETNESISVWSAGISFNENRWGTYSIFVCCHPFASGGCFAHRAYCGAPINEKNLVQRSLLTAQAIYADNGENIGNVIIRSGNIYFDFKPDWMFSGETPEVHAFGLNTSTESGTLIYSGAPQFQPQEPPYFISIDNNYPYYLIELKVQFCSTNKNWQ